MNPFILNSEKLATLKAELDLGRVGLFAGAGVGQAVGFPGWGALVDRMREAAPRPAEATPEQSDKLLAADLYRELLKDDGFGQFLKGVFAPDDLGETVKRTPLLRSLMRREYPFYVTTNYDRSLEIAYLESFGKELPSISCLPSTAVGGFLQDRSRACLHWHGIYNEPKSVVLAEGDYRRQYFQANDHRLLVRTMFYQLRFLFVGASLEDADLMYVLRELMATIAQKPRHFALLGWDPKGPEGTREKVEQRILELRLRYSIDAIYYPLMPDGDRHRVLYQILDDLAPVVEEAPAPAPAPAATGEMSLYEMFSYTVEPEDREAPAENPADPQKGRWGGSPIRDGFTLSAEVSRIGASDWFQVALMVSGPPDAKGEVHFHLHSSFPPPHPKAEFRGGEARVKLNAWGAFTVGAQVMPQGVSLELDLSVGTPEPFRSR